MSGPVVNSGGAVSLSGRTKSLDVVSSNDKDHLILSTIGEISCTSSESVGFRVGEIILSNGESYSGTLHGNMPEGSGKYVWSDGCTYEGEWGRGMKHGVGKLLFPSGAVYEGEFSCGYMQGTGTYIGPSNIVYKGRWRLNLKHGLGYQVYPHGDVFEGSWIQGTPEGPGKYTWVSGNVYLGNMKGGQMMGKGTLTWENGDTYEGSWLNSMMHGFGVYTWSDGGCYIGTWTKGLKDGKGAFYPKGSKLPAAQQVYLNALRKRGLLPDLRKQRQVSHINHASSVGMGHAKVVANNGQPRASNVSLERRWSMEVAIEKVMGHNMSDGLAELNSDSGENEGVEGGPVLEREYMQGVLISELVLDSFTSSSRRAKRRQKKLAKDVKRPGEAIIKGHRSYDLMVNLQLGIRYTVGKITPVQRREVRVSDFGSRASFWMNFPKEGSQLTPSHQSEDFRWKDYCPMVFRNLRELFKIDAADYMMSICGNDALRELSSPGKSGSVFFLSQDDRFMIKTLRKSEVKVLLQMLPDYHHHVRTYENTLITKFFGLHRIKPSSGQKFRFVVMGNMFCTELRIHRRFDLKGSSLGRSADKVEIDENTILKDLDLNYCFYLEPSWREELLKCRWTVALPKHMLWTLSFCSCDDVAKVRARVWTSTMVQRKALLRISKWSFQLCMYQIEIDSKFLEAQHIMDYSLLLGVHYRAPQHLRNLMSSNRNMSADVLGIVAEEESVDDNYPQGLVLVPRGVDDSSVVVGPHIRGSRLKASSSTGDEEVDLLLPGTARFQIQLGVNMPARAQHMPGRVKEPLFHEAYDVVLYLGIIDILQDYNISKKIEHAYKSVQFDSLSISAVDPVFYSERFLEFIQKVFPPNASAI